MKAIRTIYTTAFQDYKNLGLDPLPIPYDENGYPTKGPRIDGWQIKAANGSYTEEDFSDPCNIGVLLGGPKNLTDIDCDSPQAVAVAGDIIGHLMQKTGTGTMIFGRASNPRSHYIFSTDNSFPTEKIMDPADEECIIEYRCVKQDGERGIQTVFPPSLWYEDGTTEQIRLESDSTSVPAFIEAKKLHDCFRMIAAVALLAKHFPVESERHHTILALAGIFVRSGMPEGKATTIITLAYLHSGGYHNDSGKAEADVKSVYAEFEKESSTTHLFGYPKATDIMPRAVVDKVLELLGIERPDANYNLTDAGNGRRLVDKHKDEIRYCVDDGEWYVWDGVRWRRDVVKKIRELSKGIAADLRNEAHNIKQPTPTGDENLDKKALSQQESRKREIVKWANQSENADRVSKTIISAASDPRITCFRTDFDQRGDLLNCRNCVVNLYTGETMPHDRKLMMSNLCPVEYEPNATHRIWNESLAAFTRDHPDLTGFLQRIAGYSIQGDKSEERIFLLYGPGNAGKGTFMDWLTNALGPDYACAMDANSVLKQKRDSAAASGDIARLEGKRIVVVSEIEKGKRLEESFMKQASGNDALVARGLYQSEREFRPTHQFWFQTNYRPGFDSTDSGNKRRYVEIPFDNDLSSDPKVKFDAKIKIRMRQDAEFLKAVLAWCVQGCIEWRMHGLDIPESVTKATAQLFAHNDFLKDFLTEMCMADANEKVPVKDLWDEYKRWCEGQGEEPAQGRTFNRMMEERGFERKQARVHGVSGKAWNGIRLKEHDELVAGLRDDDAGSQEDIKVPAMNVKRFPARQKHGTVFGSKTMVG
jgi:P4 family phage/plasmid primase-like protien